MFFLWEKVKSTGLEEYQEIWMEEKSCKCLEVKWECWIKEYDSDRPDFAPALWFSTECAACGATDFKPHSEIDESTIPKEILERGLKGLKLFAVERGTEEGEK